MRRGAKPTKAKVKAKRPAAGARDLEKRLAESLKQQAATAEILRVIGSSPMDTQPVFDGIVRSGVRVCGSRTCTLFVVDGDMVRVGATHGVPVERLELFRTQFPAPLSGENQVAQVLRERRIFHLADIEHNPAATPEDVGNARVGRYRTRLMVPMLRGDSALGMIAVTRLEPTPFTDQQVALLKTFADQAVIAIENVRLFTELEGRNRELTATSEILRVISSSPTDVQPVFDTIVRSAARLCDGLFSALFQFDGEMIRHGAQHNVDPKTLDEILPARPSRAFLPGRAILERAVVHIPDVELDPEFRYQSASRAIGFRSGLWVPMLRGGNPIGVISVTRAEPGPFSESEIALLKTFADQAVIAIENVRLFTELEQKNRALSEAHAQVTEALEQQTATSEILAVISSSPTDIQPVFDTLAESAARLCESFDALIFLRDGDRVRLVANYGSISTGGPIGEFTLPLIPGTVSGRTVLNGRAIHVADIQAEVEEFPVGSETGRRLGHRAVLSVPLMREGVAIGSIGVRRTEARLFTDRQVALLQTFADQAVIAIENVRLFTELEARNREVTEALDQETATSEILGVISSSPTDAQPVFDMIAESAARLCEAQYCFVYRFEGQLLHFVAHHGLTAEVLEINRRAYPAPPSRKSVAARAVLERSVVQIADVNADPDYALGVMAAAGDYRSAAAVPILRDGLAIGSIAVTRVQPGLLPARQIELLKTFADQAVIAIENVRLFTELREKNEALTVAHAQVSETLEQQTATAEILRVISSSPTDVQPVFDVIVERAVRLCGARFGRVYRFDDGVIHMVAGHGLSPVGLGELQRVFPRPAGDDTIVGRVILSRQPLFVRDIEREEGVPALSRTMTQALGTRSQITIPMLRAGEPIGAMTLGWAEPEAFDERQIALVKTFADQGVIAIENVRLFTELQASNRDLTSALDTQTATSDILRVISRSQTNVQPVFDAIVASAVRLLGAYTGALSRIAGDQIVIAALTGHDAAADAAVRATFPVSLQSEVPHAQAIRDRAPLNIADYATDPRLPEALRASTPIRGYRSLVVVPMLRHDEAIGSIGVTRREAGGFTADEIALLKTFADQAVIAIENARLLSELQQKNEALTQAHAQVSEALEQQTATAEILRVISRSQTDVQPVFDTIVRSAVALCDGLFSALFKFDGELLHLVAHHNFSSEGLEEVRRLYPTRPARNHGSGRAILERAVVHLPDVEADSEYQHLALSRAVGWRSGLFVPMLREGAPIGVILVARAQVGPFSDSEIELLKTFADQAVIAVENVRLFKELEARTADLTRSVEQLTALGDVGRAVSSTLDLETVLTTIVSRAVELSKLDGGVVFEYEEAAEEFVHRAATEAGGALAEARRATRIRKGEGVVGRTAITLEPVQVPDITVPGAHESRLRENLIESGVRAILAVPMVREGRLIGSLVVSRNQPGDFPTETIELLRTFASQSALAIQNARLFHEIADKSRQLEAASRHKSEFLANMSHELRTPLNAIIGFSEVLNERMFGELNDKQAEYLRDIHASGTHLLSLINDILDLSKVEAGRMELELTDFDLPAAIDSALTLVRERATRRGIALGATIGDGIGGMTGDERKIRQVLLNLLSNAIKFTPEGGRIEVAAVPNGGSVEVSVRDTGVGIAPEDLEAVFEEFRQVGASAAKQEGTGLGLALCRKFVELHGGKIWVKSQIGAGSTFTFALPVQRPSGA